MVWAAMAAPYCDTWPRWSLPHAGGHLRREAVAAERPLTVYSLENLNLPALTKQIAPLRRRHFVQRPAGPTAIEIAPASRCAALRAINATRVTSDLQLDFRQPYV